MSARIAWNAAEDEFPPSGSVRQKLEHVLKCAAMATAMEGWQPWQSCVREAHIELRANDSQEFEEVDPEGRDLMIRCGAALFYLKLTMKRFGCLGRVEVFPDFGDTQLVARLYCSQGNNRSALETEVLESMTRNPKTFARSGEPPISEAILLALRSAVANEKALLEFSQSESSRQWLLELTQSRADNEQVNVGFSLGLFRNTRVARWTLPLLTFALPAAGSASSGFKGSDEQADRIAAIALLKTKTDDKCGWLAAGQSRARVQFQARVANVTAYVFDRAFRRRQVRNQLRTAIGQKGFAQAIIGFGSDLTESGFTLGTQRPVVATLP